MSPSVFLNDFLSGSVVLVYYKVLHPVRSPNACRIDNRAGWRREGGEGPAVDRGLRRGGKTDQAMDEGMGRGHRTGG